MAQVNGTELTALFSSVGAPVMGRVFVATVTTNASGQWSIAVPVGVFATSPIIHAMPVSADNTTANGAYASVVTPVQSGGAWTLSGLVLIPATIKALGGSPVTAAGAGVIVMVLAIGN